MTTLRNACDTLVPSLTATGPHSSFFSRKASDLGVDRQIVELVRQQFGPRQTAQFHQLLRTLDSPGMNLLLGGGSVRFSKLSPDARVRYLRAWRDSRIPLKRSGFQALKRLTCSLFYAIPDAQGVNPNWVDIGYSAAFPVSPPPTPDDHVIQPLVPDRDMELDADVCIVGSGAGGSVAAAEIERAGYTVVVLEAGSYSTGQSVVPSEFEMTRRASERAGTLATDDLSFQLLAGRGAGGGTFVNWMASLRPPRPVLHEWESVYGIAGLTAAEFAADIEAIWRALEVNDGESQRNPNNEALWRGSLALGYREGPDFHVLHRNAVGCKERCDFCGFGCAYSCKRSTVVNFLPDAYRAGARFLFQTRAEELELSGNRVHAVRARCQSPTGRSLAIRVKCRVAVLAGGAIQTPVLLLRSGLRAHGIGRGLRLHPTTAVAGEMARDVRAWAGPPQSVAVTRFLDWEGTGHGFWIEAAPAHPGLFALATPWSDGRSHKQWMVDRFARSTATIVLLRERSHGVVSVDSHGEPRIQYALNSADRAEVRRGIQETGRVLAAAGAKSLVTIHALPVDVRAAGERFTDREFQQFLDEVDARSVAPNRCMMFSAHLMGSCPMGTNSGTSAVRPTGELWSAENVYIADASVFPSAPGVNPMITIMAMARRTSRSVVERLRTTAG
ncbi:MAG TPA: GMC family oxidoreductase N-terminal domain-containing protein [Thermoplasmata archaeon]|nr:GMC family oxidoreductase N-terminal domain-containing protein [Thermoplasmata archaeon]